MTGEGLQEDHLECIEEVVVGALHEGIDLRDRRVKHLQLETAQI